MTVKDLKIGDIIKSSKYYFGDDKLFNPPEYEAMIINSINLDRIWFEPRYHDTYCYKKDVICKLEAVYKETPIK